jgi:hypothetical protein
VLCAPVASVFVTVLVFISVMTICYVCVVARIYLSPRQQCRNVTSSRYLAMDARSDSDIPAFRRHATVSNDKTHDYEWWLIRIWKKVAAIYFKVLTRHSFEVIEDMHKIGRKSCCDLNMVDSLPNLYYTGLLRDKLQGNYTNVIYDFIKKCYSKM